MIRDIITEFTKIIAIWTAHVEASGIFNITYIILEKVEIAEIDQRYSLTSLQVLFTYIN